MTSLPRSVSGHSDTANARLRANAKWQRMCAATAATGAPGREVKAHAAVDVLDGTDRAHEGARGADAGREGPALRVLERFELRRGVLMLERVGAVRSAAISW